MARMRMMQLFLLHQVVTVDLTSDSCDPEHQIWASLMPRKGYDVMVRRRVTKSKHMNGNPKNKFLFILANHSKDTK